MIININQYLECIDQDGNKVPYCDAMKAVRKQLGFETMAEFASSLGCNVRTIENYAYGRTENPPIMLLGKISRMIEDNKKGENNGQ